MKKIIPLLIYIAMGLTADGKIGGVTYFDFIYSDEDDSTAFNFQRQYFSYAIDMSDDIKFTLVFDVGRINKYDGEDARLTLAFFIGGISEPPLKRIKNSKYESIIKNQIGNYENQ